MILLVDNYDSFVHNLARYLRRLGQETQVVRNDQLTIDDIRRGGYRAVVLSPGPCSPTEAGISLEVVRELGDELPLLGICLGHQTIGAALGGRVVRASEPRHGRTSLVHHDGTSVFAGLPTPFEACRYHSLVVERPTLPDCLRVTAWTDDGTIMGLAHRERPIIGVQFHPESILTEHGYELLANFLDLAGLARPKVAPTAADELPVVGEDEDADGGAERPNHPITF